MQLICETLSGNGAFFIFFFFFLERLCHNTEGVTTDLISNRS